MLLNNLIDFQPSGINVLRINAQYFCKRAISLIFLCVEANSEENIAFRTQETNIQLKVHLCRIYLSCYVFTVQNYAVKRSCKPHKTIL